MSESPEALLMAARSFPRFSSLPTEIRQMIWQAAAFPRIVYLEMVDDDKHTCSRVWSETSIDGPESMGFFDLDHQPEWVQVDQGPEPLWRFRTQSIPPLFLICRESRMVAKQIYTKSFGAQYTMPSTWFNFELDILYLDWGYENADGHENEDVVFNFFPDDISEDVKKVQKLAMYNGKHPVDMPVGKWIHYVLSRLDNVRSLTMVAPQHNDEDYDNLVFLDISDVFEGPRYSSPGIYDEKDFHPVFMEVFPDLQDGCAHNNLWKPSKWLWARSPYSVATCLRDTGHGGLQKWTSPDLQFKPIITAQQKLDFQQRKQEYDRSRDAKRVRVILTAGSYNSLEVSVPLLTTMTDLACLFCQTRGIDIEVNQGTVHIYEGIPSGRNDCGISLTANLYCFPYDYQNVRLDLFFRHESLPYNCSCEYITCRHTDKYQEMLWMESEDWGLRNLFQSCAHEI